MPMILSRLDLFNGQRTGTLATRTPDDVESPPAEALDQAGADGDVLFDAGGTQEVTVKTRVIKYPKGAIPYSAPISSVLMA